MKIVYVSHPYTGNEKHNVKMARKYCRVLKSDNPDWCIFNPLDNNKYMYKCNYQYDDYMNIDLAILSKCDAIVMCGEWENSRGCREEFRYATDVPDMEIYKCRSTVDYELVRMRRF